MGRGPQVNSKKCSAEFTAALRKSKHHIGALAAAAGIECSTLRRLTASRNQRAFKERSVQERLLTVGRILGLAPESCFVETAPPPNEVASLLTPEERARALRRLERLVGKGRHLSKTERSVLEGLRTGEAH